EHGCSDRDRDGDRSAWRARQDQRLQDEVSVMSAMLRRCCPLPNPPPQSGGGKRVVTSPSVHDEREDRIVSSSSAHGGREDRTVLSPPLPRGGGLGGGHGWGHTSARGFTLLEVVVAISI